MVGGTIICTTRMEIEPRPKLETYKYEMAGDKHVIQYSLIIGDADTRQVREIDINRWPDRSDELISS